MSIKRFYLKRLTISKLQCLEIDCNVVCTTQHYTLTTDLYLQLRPFGRQIFSTLVQYDFQWQVCFAIHNSKQEVINDNHGLFGLSLQVFRVPFSLCPASFSSYPGVNIYFGRRIIIMFIYNRTVYSRSVAQYDSRDGSPQLLYDGPIHSTPPVGTVHRGEGWHCHWWCHKWIDILQRC